MTNLKIFLLSFVLVSAFGLTAMAQETENTDETTAQEAVNLDEDVQPEDLAVSEPVILPDSPLYFLKNLARGIQEVFAFSPVKKAELKLKFANEKLMELKKTAKKTADPETTKKAVESYRQEIEKVKNQAEKIKEKAKENPKVESFLDKFIHQQTLHQKLLQRLETQVPPEAFEKISEARERHLEKFKDVMLKLEDREGKITEKLDKILEEQKGSQFKEFKNLEILKDLEEKLPEEAKEALKKAKENTLIRLQKDLEKVSSESQEKFKEYLDKISGEKEKHLEIMEDLKAKIKEAPETRKAVELEKKLEQGKIKIFEKIEKKSEKLNCPVWTPPAPNFCKEGKIIIKKELKTGCPLPPKCVEIPVLRELPEKPNLTQPKNPEFCIDLWNPICGRDAKTYPNECLAKIAGVEIEHSGECKKETPLE